MDKPNKDPLDSAEKIIVAMLLSSADNANVADIKEIAVAIRGLQTSRNYWMEMSRAWEKQSNEWQGKYSDTYNGRIADRDLFLKQLQNTNKNSKKEKKK